MFKLIFCVTFIKWEKNEKWELKLQINSELYKFYSIKRIKAACHIHTIRTILFKCSYLASLEAENSLRRSRL